MESAQYAAGIWQWTTLSRILVYTHSIRPCLGCQLCSVSALLFDSQEHLFTVASVVKAECVPSILISAGVYHTGTLWSGPAVSYVRMQMTAYPRPKHVASPATQHDPSSARSAGQAGLQHPLPGSLLTVPPPSLHSSRWLCLPR